jgi:hypothetical protein
MGKDLMYECERRTQFVDRTCPTDRSKRVSGWVVAAVVDIPETAVKDTRCMHCHGAVKVYRQHGPSGYKDHVEHKTHTDSENCKGGFYFKGEHRISLRPVV